MRKLIVAGSAALLLVLVGCSGDDDDTDNATSETTEAATGELTADEAAYCADLEALPDEDPGFDAFFTEHPEPTLDDWAEFLPGVVEQLRSSVEDFDAIEPPASFVDAHQSLSGAMTEVADSLDAALAAAEAGDQAAYDAAEAENQGELSPALDEAMSTLVTTCGLTG